MKKEQLYFSIKVGLVHFFAYLFIGAIAYPLFTKQFYVGKEAIFTMFLRSESSPEQWAYVMRWIFPGQLLRGLLMGFVLVPFIPALKEMPRAKRIFSVFALMYILTSFGAATPSPSNIEGLIYMRPEIISLKSFLFTQPEMILYSFVFALGVAYLVEGKLKLTKKRK